MQEVIYVVMGKVWAIVLVVMVLAGVIGGGAWYMTRSQRIKIETPEIQQVNQVAEEVVATKDSGKIVEVTVEGSNYKFIPNVINTKKGDTVILIFKSTGAIHNLVIDEFGVETNKIGDGEEEEMEFVADKAGTFEFYCSVANHRAMGMTGKLTVE